MREAVQKHAGNVLKCDVIVQATMKLLIQLLERKTFAGNQAVAMGGHASLQFFRLHFLTIPKHCRLQ